MPVRKRPTKTKPRPRAQRANLPQAAPRKARRQPRADVPQLFRLSIEVGDLDAGVKFYTQLLRVQGRKQPGSRCYFQCGPVTLSVLDVSSMRRPHPAAKALYFTVQDLDATFARAESLGCLADEEVHDAPAGGIVVRPWGERSFYAEDPWHNPLCFVEDGTVYSG